MGPYIPDALRYTTYSCVIALLLIILHSTSEELFFLCAAYLAVVMAAVAIAVLWRRFLPGRHAFPGGRGSRYRRGNAQGEYVALCGVCGVVGDNGV